jgi:hypothetical protein
LSLNVNHVRLHCRNELLIIECDDIFFAAVGLYLLYNFIIYLFGVAINLTIFHDDFVEFEIETDNFR